MTGYTCPHCRAAQLVTEQEQPPVYGCPNCGAAFYLATNDQGQLQFQWARGPREQQPAPPPAPPQQQAQPQQPQPQHITVNVPEKRASLTHRAARWGLVIWTVFACILVVLTLGAASDTAENAEDSANEDAYLAGVAIGSGSMLAVTGCIWLAGFIALGVVALVTKP